jgi:hypothetical protein
VPRGAGREADDRLPYCHAPTDGPPYLSMPEPVGSAALDLSLNGPAPTHGHWLGRSRRVAKRRNIRLAVGRGVRVRIAVRRFAWIPDRSLVIRDEPGHGPEGCGAPVKGGDGDGMIGSSVGGVGGSGGSARERGLATSKTLHHVRVGHDCRHRPGLPGKAEASGTPFRRPHTPVGPPSDVASRFASARKPARFPKKRLTGRANRPITISGDGAKMAMGG